MTRIMIATAIRTVSLAALLALTACPAPTSPVPPHHDTMPVH